MPDNAAEAARTAGAPAHPTRERTARPCHRIRSGGAELGDDIVGVNKRIATIDRKIAAMHKNNPISQLLTTIPGIGPVVACTLATTIEPTQFKSGRTFAAYLGLTPKDHSSGGK